MFCFSNFNCGLALVNIWDEHPATSLLVQHHSLLLDVLIDAPPFLQKDPPLCIYPQTSFSSMLLEWIILNSSGEQTVRYLDDQQCWCSLIAVF